MNLFHTLFKKSQPVLPPVACSDDMIVAPADGELIDITSVSDPMFAGKMLGESCAFRYMQDKVTICAPANGVLSAFFPTGHAFGIRMNNGVEILIHIGIDTVNENGNGFQILKKKQGDDIKAGEPVVEVDVAKLSQKYDMSTIIIITDPKDKSLRFLSPCTVTRGQNLLEA